MNVSDRNVDLRAFFPFRSCSEALLTRAQALGRCVKYNTGERVLLSGSPAKHCGLIVDGQAVAFKIDENGKRYQLCLDEGCYIGLETVQSQSSYNAKIAALSDLEVFFWNEEGIAELMNDFPEFANALVLLDNGRLYQEQWLIPETDVTDPVLCSLPAHWLSVAAPAAGILLVLFICLWTSSLLIRRYPVAWLLVLCLFVAAGSLIYRVVSKRMNERLIVTTRNLILIPGANGTEMSVSRLSRIQSLKLNQNIFEKLADIGRVEVLKEDDTCRTPLLSAPLQTAVLIRFFAEKASQGRPVPLTGKPYKTIPERHIAAAQPQPSASPVFAASTPSEDPGHSEAKTAVPKFQTISFHAHWALLIKMLLKPLLALAAVLFLRNLLRTSPYWIGINKILLFTAALAAAAMIYQFIAWQNHRFYIEEDRVRDYSQKPLTGEDQNVAMNNKIHSVRYEKKGLFQVLLNYGTVYILAGEGELSFDYVKDPQSVQQQIMDNCARYEAQQMMNAESRQREYINNLISGIRKESEIPFSPDNL
ncbi:MAG: cyclic nucleotide-binding domain-containing protein [Flexilinea sp.]|nr:cyclic nucleotide-binding domain-containing protein [Flexilinea sp.]